MIAIPHLTTSQAKELLTKHGPNSLRETVSHTPLSIIIEQFTSILVLLLIGAAVVSFFLGDALDGALILAIVVLNAALGFAQEFKAEKALSALKKMTVSTVKVLRDQSATEIPSSEIVPGDIIFLEEGDKVPADAEVVEAMHFEVNE